MFSFMEAFEKPVPEMPKMERLISLVQSGKPWGTKTQKSFEELVD
jgi:hypothetical protein